MNAHSIFIVGCGDIGSRVARIWLANDWTVSALARSEETEARLAALGVDTIRGDLDDPDSLHGVVPDGALLYYFAPPPTDGTTDPRMAALLGSLIPGHLPGRVVYISTSGVYGDQGGSWVDESTAPAPGADRARRRLDAEHSLVRWGQQRKIPAIILRVPGIYGPGRLPRARLERGEPVLRENESGFSNRVHIEDLVTACVAAGERPNAAGIYNVSDGVPTTMTDYFNAVADCLGLRRPPQISLAEAREQLSRAMIDYLTESRRIGNHRLREELGVTLRYPSLAEGLKEICEGN